MRLLQTAPPWVAAGLLVLVVVVGLVLWRRRRRRPDGDGAGADGSGADGSPVAGSDGSPADPPVTGPEPIAGSRGRHGADPTADPPTMPVPLPAITRAGADAGRNGRSEGTDGAPDGSGVGGRPGPTTAPRDAVAPGGGRPDTPAGGAPRALVAEGPPAPWGSADPPTSLGGSRSPAPLFRPGSTAPPVPPTDPQTDPDTGPVPIPGLVPRAGRAGASSDPAGTDDTPPDGLPAAARETVGAWETFGVTDGGGPGFTPARPSPAAPLPSVASSRHSRPEPAGDPAVGGRDGDGGAVGVAGPRGVDAATVTDDTPPDGVRRPVADGVEADGADPGRTADPSSPADAAVHTDLAGHSDPAGSADSVGATDSAGATASSGSTEADGSTKASTSGDAVAAGDASDTSDVPDGDHDADVAGSSLPPAVVVPADGAAASALVWLRSGRAPADVAAAHGVAESDLAGLVATALGLVGTGATHPDRAATAPATPSPPTG